MKQIKNDQPQSENIPQCQKYPKVFKWKTASLVIICLIAIVCVIDACLGIYLAANANPQTNSSFFNDVLTNSTNETLNYAQAKFLLRNIIKADPKIYFQKSQLVYQTSSNNFTPTVLKKIFKKNSKDLLFIFEVQNVKTNQGNKFGFFVVPDFPIPENTYNRSYYTFQFGITRQSMLFNLNTDSYVVMNGGQDGSQRNVNQQCKTYQFHDTFYENKTQQNLSFEVLKFFTINFNNSQQKIEQGKFLPYCYKDVEDFKKEIIKIIGFNVSNDNVIIKTVTVFHLYNQK